MQIDTGLVHTGDKIDIDSVASRVNCESTVRSILSTRLATESKSAHTGVLKKRLLQCCTFLAVVIQPAPPYPPSYSMPIVPLPTTGLGSIPSRQVVIRKSWNLKNASRSFNFHDFRIRNEMPQAPPG